MHAATPPRLRAATHDDVAQLMSFWATAAANDGRAADDAGDVHRLIDRDAEALLLAEMSGVVVGSLICGWDGWRFHLYRLAVHPDWRGRGIGRALVTAAEQRCHDLGSKRVDAMVLADNALAASFWQAAGFQRQEEWRRWVKPTE